MSARVPFKKAIREALAKRAGYKCSFPECNRITVGPGVQPHEFEVSGVACHIFSAAPRGPRGQGTLGSDDISSASNGIWLCSHHASLVDKNRGARYPASLLSDWKAAHEQRIAFEHNGLLLPRGWIRSLTVHSSPVFARGRTIAFDKATLITGPNGSGKTAVCEWLAMMSTSKHLSRWATSGKPLQFEVAFSNSAHHTLRVFVDGHRQEIHLDDRMLPLAFTQFTLTYIGERIRSFAGSDLDLFCAFLGLEQPAVRALAEHVESPGCSSLAGAKWICRRSRNGRESWQLMCTLRRGDLEYSVPFRGAMSGGQQMRILLDFVIAHLQSAAQLTPTVLILECSELPMDEGSFRPYINFFCGPESTFQTIMTAPCWLVPWLSHPRLPIHML
jgi:hypothetical protein